MRICKIGWWPQYQIKDLGITWRFFSIFTTDNWAIGFIKLESSEAEEIP